MWKRASSCRFLSLKCWNGVVSAGNNLHNSFWIHFDNGEVCVLHTFGPPPERLPTHLAYTQYLFTPRVHKAEASLMKTTHTHPNPSRKFVLLLRLFCHKVGKVNKMSYPTTVTWLNFIFCQCSLSHLIPTQNIRFPYRRDAALIFIKFNIRHLRVVIIRNSSGRHSTDSKSFATLTAEIRAHFVGQIHSEICRITLQHWHLDPGRGGMGHRFSIALSKQI